MPTVNELYQDLAKAFPPEAVMRKPGGGGKMLDYVTARHIMNRLDAVVGPNRWSDDYQVITDGPIPGVICKLTIEFEVGEPVTKCGFGSFEAMGDNDNAFKSGESNALRRAAVKFGIGRNLYKNGVVVFSDEEPGGEEVYGNQPAPRPTWMANSPSPQQSQPAPVSGGSGQPSPQANGNLPQHGGQLFAWAKTRENNGEVGVIKWFDGWGQSHGCPRSYKEWRAEDVQRAAAEFMGGGSAPAAQPAPQSNVNGQSFPIPTDVEKPGDGRGLFKLIKKIEERFPIAFLNPINEFGKSNNFAGRMVDWNPADVTRAWQYLGSLVAKQKQDGNIPAGEYFGLNGQPAPQPQQSAAPYNGSARLAEIKGVVADIVSLRGEEPKDEAIFEELVMIMDDCHQGKAFSLVLTDPAMGDAVLATVKKDLEGRRVAAGGY